MSRHLVIMAAGTGDTSFQASPWLRKCSDELDGVPGSDRARAGKQARAGQGSGADALAFSGMRGKGLEPHAARRVGFARALFQTSRVFRQRKADAVLGMGGYVCLPGGLMAWLTGRPLMLINADAAMLLSNRCWRALRSASASASMAPLQRPRHVRSSPATRCAADRGPCPHLRNACWARGPLRLLVVGGSLGARALNAVVPAALAHMPRRAPPSSKPDGRRQPGRVQAGYAAAGGVQGEVLPFIDDMAAALADADLVLCRAGAITVSEICAAGSAAILVPLVVSTTSHQRDNARFLAQHGAGIHLPQEELTRAEALRATERTEPPTACADGQQGPHWPAPGRRRVADELKEC